MDKCLHLELAQKRLINHSFAYSILKARITMIYQKKLPFLGSFIILLVRCHFHSPFYTSPEAFRGFSQRYQVFILQTTCERRFLQFNNNSRRIRVFLKFILKVSQVSHFLSFKALLSFQCQSQQIIKPRFLINNSTDCSSLMLALVHIIRNP